MKRIFTAVVILICSFRLAHAQVPTYVPTNGLVGWWPFNGNANDESGNGNNGTGVNSPSFVKDRFGNSSSCLSLNGINQRVDLPLNLNGALLNLQQLSISSYVNTDSLPGPYGIFSNWKAFPLVDPFGFNFNLASGRICAGTNAGAGVFVDSFNCGNKWQHLVVTFDGTQLNAVSRVKLYLNGKLQVADSTQGVYSNTAVASFLGSSGTNTAFGAWFSQFGWVGHFSGLLDDIGIWNRVLDSVEIASLYNTNVTGYENLSTETIELSPNPASTILTVNNNSAIKEANILSIDGRFIQKTILTVGKNSIDITAIENGIYILKVGDKVSKFSVVH
jgi:hypothetical protein